MKSYQTITRSALLIALCVVLGYLFMPVPNLEMITAGIFISGVWMGPKLGLLIGMIAEAIYSLSNPMGFPPPPLLITQVGAMGFVGLSGGFMRRLLSDAKFFAGRKFLRHLILAGSGLVLTLIYDLLTNISFPLAAGFSLSQMRAFLILGIPYAVIHIATNVAIFAIVIPAVLVRFPIWRNP